MKSHYHCVYDMKLHLVLVTKYRKKCFTDDIISKLRILCAEQCQKWDIQLLEFDGESDHIHLLLDFHPSVQPSKFINSLKTVTSRLIRKEFSVHLQEYYCEPVLWSRAYCLVSCGGAPLEIIKQYVKNRKGA
jgi:putative transposase